MNTITVNKGKGFDMYGQKLMSAVKSLPSTTNNISIIDNGEDGSIRFLSGIFATRYYLKNINLSRVKNI